ncbi:MAG TPA: peptidase M61, partial [Pricia sp.]|nr:peptidase M61 [Pricia sp.]
MNRMKKWVLLTVTGLVFYSCGSTKASVTADKTPIRTSMDLKNVVDDKVMVSVNPGAFTTDDVSFLIPKTVPGTYSTDNYGKYIEDFKALDYDGKELAVTKSDDNTWNITNGKNLDKVTYFVNDTYDTESKTEDAVFSPAGTNILKDKNFMLNLHAFVGYFKGLQEVPYEIEISVPENLKPTTTLTMKDSTDGAPGKDTFLASRYFEVIDNPILYAEPNTETFKLNDIEIKLSVYSPNDVYKASD